MKKKYKKIIKKNVLDYQIIFILIKIMIYLFKTQNKIFKTNKDHILIKYKKNIEK
jgi:hypothetical protein